MILKIQKVDSQKNNMNIARTKYIRQLQKDILSHVYTHQKRTISEKMFVYAIRNQNMLGSNTNTFIHNGEWYSGGDPIRAGNDYKPNRELHPELKEEIIKLFQKSFDLKVQETILLTHFGNVLITARKHSDLIELLPYPLHNIISLVDRVSFNIGPPLTKLEITQFKEDNIDGITCLNSMLLLELLLSK